MRIESVVFISASLALCSCQVQPYAPPPQKALVESVEVQIRDFHGRPDAHAIVKGRMSSNAAQLVDHKQSRDGDRLYIDVLEQTPRGAALTPNLTDMSPFQTSIPIELLGLEPGTYTLSANGIETTFEVPPLQAEAASDEYLASVGATDEFIPIEDSVFVDPATIETVEIP